MQIAFAETAEFTASLTEYFPTDDHYRLLQLFLSNNPEAGPVIRGTGGLRKARWPDIRRGMGKRGGLRVIYIYVPQASYIGFVTVYGKDESDDLTAEQRSLLRVAAARLRADLMERREGPR